MVRVLFIIPEINAYWKDVLLAWRRSVTDLKVLIGWVTPSHTDLSEWGPWIECLGSRSQSRPMYYGSLRDRHPTPLATLLRRFVQIRPEHIVAYGFSGWTLLACVWRRLRLAKRLTILWEGSTPGVDMKGDHLRQMLRRWALASADQACTQSQEGADYLTSLGTRVKPTISSWLCVDPSHFESRPGHNRGETIRFVFVGSVEKRKGVDFLLDVVRQLPGNWQLDLIGPILWQPSGPPDPKINWLGPRSPQQIKALLKDYDVFLFPTREETWGVAPIEAAAAGLVVVTSTSVPAQIERPHWISLAMEKNVWVQALAKIVAAPQAALDQAPLARRAEVSIYAQARAPWLA